MEQFTKEKTTKNEDLQRHHCVFALRVLGETWREFGFGLAVLTLFLLNPSGAAEGFFWPCQVSAHPQPNLNALTRQVNIRCLQLWTRRETSRAALSAGAPENSQGVWGCHRC